MHNSLSNLVKVECEYLLPFLCDIFDLIFERRKEIQIDDLLEYFVGLYEIPQFTTISDDDNENKNENENENEIDNKSDSDTTTKIGHNKSNKSLISNISELEDLTIVNNDVDDTIDIE